MGSINTKESTDSFTSLGSSGSRGMGNGSDDGGGRFGHDDGGSDGPAGDDTVPHVFTWEHGGQQVMLTGTFTGWERHIPMHRSGHDFVTIVNLPRGKHAFKFIVDSDWRFSPEQPVIRDASGNINNYCDLTAFAHNDTEPIDYERKASNPALAYGHSVPDIDDYTRAPPMLPPHLRHIILNAAAQEDDPHTILEPQHVTLNHLYCTVFRDGLMVQGITQRHKRKFVTTVYYSSAAASTDVANGVGKGAGGAPAGVAIPPSLPTVRAAPNDVGAVTARARPAPASATGAAARLPAAPPIAAPSARPDAAPVAAAPTLPSSPVDDVAMS